MKHLTRVAIFFVFLIVSSFAAAKPARAVPFWELFKKNKSIEKNTNSLIESLKDPNSTDLEKHLPKTSEILQADGLLTVAGPSTTAMMNATDEEKRLVYEKYGNGGLIGQTTQAIAMLYTPAASGTTYVAGLLQDAHIIPRAQAQGLGFASLDPVLETWKVFRNVAYFFFVAIFLIIGFMIMFRQKIDGQAVVTAQQAIPGIVVALVFVTFSYAIAGFLIDLMYLLMYLMIGLFKPEGGTELMSKTFIQIGWDLVTGVNNNGAFANMNEAVKEFAASINTSAIGDVLGWIGGLTLGLIISIAILIGVFKLFFELLKIYITIIIAIVMAPILLMMGAIPGKANVGYWMKLVFGNLLAFPMVLFSLILYEMFTKGDLSTGGFMPPYLIGRGSGSVIMSLVGIGIILIIPELIAEMKKAMKIDGGIWETLAMKAVSQAKEGVPLGTRGVALGLGGVSGAAGMANEFYKAKRGGASMGQSIEAAIPTDPEKIKEAKANKTGAYAGRKWAEPAFKAADYISRKTNANQPDILNLATDPLDKRYNPEGHKRKVRMEDFEDVVERLDGGGGNVIHDHDNE